MGILSKLLKFARAVVQGVLNQINQQLRVIEEAAMNPINQMVQGVVGGAWRGKGADAFVQEMQSEVLPAFGRLVGAVTNTNVQLNRAAEILQAADMDGASRVNSLVDMFRGIY
jgi:hypothetical protein